MELNLNNLESIFLQRQFLTSLNKKQDDIQLSRSKLLALAFFKGLRDEVLRNDKTLLVTVEGTHRSGKSTTSSCISDLFDPSFSRYFSFRVVHSPMQFTDAVRVIKREKIKGACIVVDEAGASFESGAWYTAWMKALQKTLIVCGYLNIIIFFCSTNRDFLDGKVKKLAHQHWIISRYDNNENVIKVYLSKYNTIRQKEFYPHPKVRLFGQMITLEKIRFSRPPEELLDNYRALETPRKDQMLEELSQEVSKSDKESKQGNVDITKIIGEITSDYLSYTSSKSTPEKIMLDQSLINYNYPMLKASQAKYIKISCEKQLNKIREVAVP